MVVLSEGTETRSAAGGRTRPRSNALLVLLVGADPGLSAADDEQASFVRAHGLAAVRAGWDPIIMCMGPTADERDEPWGHVVRLGTGSRTVQPLALRRLEGPLGRAMLELGEGSNVPVLAHGFGVWGAAAVSAVEVLRHRGRTAAAAISCRTLFREEREAQLRNTTGESPAVRVRMQAAGALSAAAVDRREHWAYRRADRIWVNHGVVRRLVHERHGSELDVRLVPYGIEASFEPLPTLPVGGPDPWHGTPPGQLRVVSFTQHRADAGLDVLLEAIERLGEPPLPMSVTAVLLGGGPLLGAHQRLAAQLQPGSSACISVLGPVADVHPHLLGADLVVVPARAEPSGPTAVLEAQRLGLTVIATSVDGVPDEVVSGESGILVPPDDSSSLAAAMATLSVDPGMRARLGQGGRARFVERHGADAFVTGLGAAYSELLTCALDTAG